MAGHCTVRIQHKPIPFGFVSASAGKEVGKRAKGIYGG